MSQSMNLCDVFRRRLFDCRGKGRAMNEMWTADSIGKDYGGRLVLNSPNIINLCLDSYDNERQRGKLYHQYTPDAIVFATLFEAFGRMEQLYDKLCYPQAATRIRSFSEGRPKPAYGSTLESPSEKREEIKVMESFEEMIGHRGRDATFLIRVKCRQNSSWQGEVTWVDEQKRKYFRSALELIRLIDSAMGAADD